MNLSKWEISLNSFNLYHLYHFCYFWHFFGLNLWLTVALCVCVCLSLWLNEQTTESTVKCNIVCSTSWDKLRYTYLKSKLLLLKTKYYVLFDWNVLKNKTHIYYCYVFMWSQICSDHTFIHTCCYLEYASVSHSVIGWHQSGWKLSAPQTIDDLTCLRLNKNKQTNKKQHCVQPCKVWTVK